MGKLVMCTVGFDEKLVFRSLLKVGVSIGDAVALVYSRSGSDYDIKRVENAVRNIKELLDAVGVKHYDVVVSGMDFVSDVVTIVNGLREFAKEEKIVGVVSGGMRIAVLEAIVSLLLYRKFINRKAEVEIHVSREDGLYDVTLSTNLLDLPNLSLRELDVLKQLEKIKVGISERGGTGSEGVLLSEVVEVVSQNLNVSKFTVYKLLHRLKSKNLIMLKDRVVLLTDLGKLIQEVVKQ